MATAATAHSITVYPAIDLKDGQCVRLVKGEMDQATVYSDDPAGQAQAFADAGCRYLHIVDLNGAFEGAPVNADAVRAIRAATQLPTQLGGGIRTLATMEQWLDIGIDRLILGTLAVRDPDLVKAACKAFPGKIAVGVDAKAGFVAVEGWAEASTLDIVTLSKQFEDCGVAALIHTDIDRDGMLSGVNADASADLARAVDIPVIASGGVASIDDIHRVYSAKVLEGVITGKALYDGRLDLGAALVAAQGGVAAEGGAA